MVDPRAELLALQLKPKPTGKDERRVRQLLKAKGRSWPGPLEPRVSGIRCIGRSGGLMPFVVGRL
jgi:hypothetical protein